MTEEESIRQIGLVMEANADGYYEGLEAAILVLDKIDKDGNIRKCLENHIEYIKSGKFIEDIPDGIYMKPKKDMKPKKVILKVVTED